MWNLRIHNAQILGESSVSSQVSESDWQQTKTLAYYKSVHFLHITNL
jgi:hypothetical protein